MRSSTTEATATRSSALMAIVTAMRSDGNGDEVIRSNGNSNGDNVLRSDGNDDEVIRSGSNGDEIGDKMLVVEDDGKLPVRTKEDGQAAQALVHLASL